MKFSKRNKYISLALLVILNVVIRLPVMSHETGIDSFFIHRLATSISTEGYAKWIIHPLSFTGLYPMSYASSSPFFLSGMSQITGINIEHIILFLCILLGIFSVFSTFLFAGEIKDDDVFAFLVSFIYSLSPVFLLFTIWQATTRNIFIAFFPLFLWALLRCRNSFSGKYIGIAIVSLSFLIFSHKLCLFIPLIFIAFIAAVILTLIYQKVKPSMVFSNSKILNKLSFIIFPVTFLLLFSIQFSGIDFYNNYLQGFYTGYLFEGEDTYIVILNIAADYFGKVGFVLFFGLIGFISLARTAFNGFGRLFVVLSILTLTPFLVIQVYTPEIILPFFSILVGFGLISTYDILKQRRRIVFKKAALSLLVICIVVSTGFSWFMLDHWKIHEMSMSDKTYASASFLKDNANDTSVANSGLLSCQLSSFSGEACLPYGGAYAQSTAPEQLIYGSVKPDEVVIGQLLSPSEIISRRRLYALKTKSSDAKEDWADFVTSFPGANKTKIVSSKYDAHYVIEDIRIYGQFWHWKQQYSRLLVNLHVSGNKIYDNDGENIWYLS